MTLKNKKADKYGILLVYSRKEHSKDINESKKSISLSNDTINYYEKYWRFMTSSKNISKNEIDTNDQRKTGYNYFNLLGKFFDKLYSEIE